MSALWKRTRPRGPTLVRMNVVEAEFEKLLENTRRGTTETRPIRVLQRFALKESLRILKNAAKKQSEW